MRKSAPEDFYSVYGDGKQSASAGIPLFVFNYLDYKIWNKYNCDIRGGKDDDKRNKFFEWLGCPDFRLDPFDKFYFSRTRRSLEHYYPQSQVKAENSQLTETEINCFGNYAMIGSEANSSGSNWEPMTKITHYLNDKSGKINKVSVASLKFLIMMKSCEKANKWTYKEIQSHQEHMVNILFDIQKKWVNDMEENEAFYENGN